MLGKVGAAVDATTGVTLEERKREMKGSGIRRQLGMKEKAQRIAKKSRRLQRCINEREH